MTRERTAELLENGVLKAWRDGRKLQFCWWKRPGEMEWEDSALASPDFTNEDLKWRIKPQPRERWIVVFRDGSERLFDSLTEAEAQRACNLARVKEIFRVEEKE